MTLALEVVQLRTFMLQRVEVSPQKGGQEYNKLTINADLSIIKNNTIYISVQHA